MTGNPARGRFVFALIPDCSGHDVPSSYTKIPVVVKKIMVKFSRNDIIQSLALIDKNLIILYLHDLDGIFLCKYQTCLGPVYMRQAGPVRHDLTYCLFSLVKIISAHLYEKAG